MNRVDALKRLGLKEGFNISELKTAYRKSVMKHHPDQGGSEVEFIRTRLAYDTLKVGRRSKVWVQTTGTYTTNYVRWNWDGSANDKAMHQRNKDLLELKKYSIQLDMKIGLSLSGTHAFSITNIHGIPVHILLGVSVDECKRKIKEMRRKYVP